MSLSTTEKSLDPWNSKKRWENCGTQKSSFSRSHPSISSLFTCAYKYCQQVIKFLAAAGTFWTQVFNVTNIFWKAVNSSTSFPFLLSLFYSSLPQIRKTHCFQNPQISRPALLAVSWWMCVYKHRPLHTCVEGDICVCAK